MTGKLTKKQEAFAVKYVECGDASEAYRHAYEVKTMSAKSINEEASKLLTHPKISPRVDELRSIAKETTENQFKYTVEWRLKKLESIIDAGLSTYNDAYGNARRENLAAAKGALDTINSMLGNDEDDSDTGEKLQITFNVSEPVRDVKVTRGE